MLTRTILNRPFIVRLVLCLSLLTLGVLLGASPVHAAAGELDLTFAGFGSGGTLITRAVSGRAYAMALQPDDKIVVAGCSGSNLLVMRYLSNGALDSTFGANGNGIATFSNVFSLCANAVALQADGKIVVAGSFGTSPSNFMLARLTPTGGLDTSFGSGGLVSTDFDNGADFGDAVLVQTDGKIVVAGWAHVGGDDDFAAARYNANGSPDNGFGGDGKVTIGFGADDVCQDIALQDDGKLVLAGYTTGGGFDFAVARLNGDGTPDNAFDGDGKVTTGFGDLEVATAVGIMADGRIVVAGDNIDNAVVARYHANGSLDNSFDDDGKLSIGGLSGEIDDMALQPDGKIVLLGEHRSPDNDHKFAFYRLNLDGALDTTFFGVGYGFPDFGGLDSGRALALQPDGRLVAAGYTYPVFPGPMYPVLMRVWQDGTPDAGGQQTLGFDDPLFGSGSRELANAMAVQSDGKIILAGQIRNAAGTATDFAIARFWPDGQLDGSFGTNGRIVFGLGEEVARAVVVQPADDKIVVGGYTGAGNGVNFVIARFTRDGKPDSTFGYAGYNVLDFLGGADYGIALALAPDGKIVMGGNAFNGARDVFGVARFNSDGTPDLSFDEDGKTLYEFEVGPVHHSAAVVVQPDRKIVLGGHVGADFALVRLTENGLVDYGFGTYPYGHVVTDLGGSDYLYALLLMPNGWFVAAGSRVLNGSSDFALAQYDPNGAQPLLVPGGPWARAFVDWGGSEAAFALDRRGDGQIVAAGCADGKFAWAQLPTNTQVYTPLKGTTDFPGGDECATGVKFAGANRLIAAGYQTWEADANFAIARFETTVDSTVPMWRLLLPLIRR